MLFVSTAEDLANSVGKLVSTEQPLGLNYLPLAMNPLRLDRIEPRALGGQQTRHYSDPMTAGFDLAVVGDDPLSLTSWLLCQLALSQMRSRASLPLCWSLWQHHPRNRVVMALTGRPSTNLSQVSSISGRYSPEQERAFGSGSSFLASFSRRRTGFVASDQECREGRSKRENHVSSSKPTAHCGWLWARRISRSRAPFFERIPDRGSRSSAWPAPSALPAAKA